MKSRLNQLVKWNVAGVRIAWVVFLLWVALLYAATPCQIRVSPGADGLAIQMALDRLPDEGGEVLLPAGIYEIRQPVVLRRNNQTLRGSGPRTILRLADNANCPVIIMGEPVNAPSKKIRHSRVAGFFIDGNRFKQQRELWREHGEGCQIRNNGITVQAAVDCSVENVIAARNRSGGLVTTLGVERLTVCGLESYNNEFDGLACYLTTNSLFADLNLHHNPGAGISLDLDFNHNVISNATLAANDLGIFMRDSYDNQFQNVSISSSRQHGVFMAQSEIQVGTGGEPLPRTECAQNAFTNLHAMNCGGVAIRVNDATCTNNFLIHPRFYGNRKGDLSLAGPNLLIVSGMASADH